MDEITIRRHNFDLAKNRLKEFSEKTEAELEIDKVQTDGGFLGLGDHKVTGYEFNRRLETIQGHFIAVNTTNNRVIKEFREIYNALDVLDKDYLASIVANVKAIEKSSNDVRVQQGILKQHNEKLANQQSKLDAHQDEIEKNVANISKIVTALKAFKRKLESYGHLTDIDKIWSDCEIIQNEIRVVSGNITKLSKKTTEDIASANNKNKALSDEVLALRNEAKSLKEFFSDLSEKIECTADLLDNQIPVIQETSVFAERLKNFIHIDDVDSMWDDLDVLKTNIQKINKDIKGNRKNIQMHQKELNTLATTSDEHKESIDILFKKLADAEEYAVNSRNSITELVQADSRILKRIDLNGGEINVLKKHKEKLDAISHLEDVDSIWRSVEEHVSQLTESGKRDEELAAAIQQNKDEVDQRIADAVQTANAVAETLTKRVQYAYWIAGGSAGLAIIELMLLLMKVI